MAKLIYVKIAGTGIYETIVAKSHEILGQEASTYHLFVLENGTRFYLNDFGIRSLTIADSIDDLK
jgi:hypothetical protein